MASFSAMGEPHQRLISARKAAGFQSARAAALRHHWTVSTYASHENGQTPLPHHAALEYGKAFRASPGWLLTGEGEMRPGSREKFMNLYETLPPERKPQAIEFLELLHRQRK